MNKPKCKLIGTDGNVFALVGRVIQSLKKSDHPEKVQEFQNKLFLCKSYEEALALMCEYVDIK